MKLKPCPLEFQAVSNAMMAVHNATSAVEDAAANAVTALEAAYPLLQADGVLLAELHATGILPMRKLALVSSESRAAHHGMSKVLQRLGYELPVVQTRGPGGGR
jgi:hypothetical protein